MAKRRGNHEGTIFKRKNGTWRAQVSIHGRRLSHSTNTQKECQDWIKKTIKQLDAGYSYDSAQTTLKTYLQTWLSRIRNSRSSRTLNIYQATVDRDINPYLGKIRLKELRTEHIQRLYDLFIAEGATPYTIKRIHKVLHCAIEDGIKLGLFIRNPASGTSRPKLEQGEMQFYTEDQVQQMLKVARDVDESLFALYYLAIHTGMRKSELLGLSWNDFNWKKKSIKVHRQLRWKKGGTYELAPPKTQSGTRTINLGQAAIRILRAHQTNQGVGREAGDTKRADNGLVFSTTEGKPLKDYNFYQSFKRLIQKARLPNIRFHDLRHTAASLMLNYGIPVIIVSKRLGHARPSITMDVYGHLMPSKQEEAAMLMDDLMVS